MLRICVQLQREVAKFPLRHLCPFLLHFCSSCSDNCCASDCILLFFLVKAWRSLSLFILCRFLTDSYVYKWHPLSPGTLRRQLSSNADPICSQKIPTPLRNFLFPLDFSCRWSVPGLKGCHLYTQEPVG